MPPPANGPKKKRKEKKSLVSDQCYCWPCMYGAQVWVSLAINLVGSRLAAQKNTFTLITVVLLLPWNLIWLKYPEHFNLIPYFRFIKQGHAPPPYPSLNITLAKTNFGSAAGQRYKAYQQVHLWMVEEKQSPALNPIEMLF